MQNTDIDDEALKYVSDLSGLINLGLSKTLIKGQTISLLGRCTKLQILDIGRTPFETKYLDALANLKSLNHLSIESCGLTDHDLETLSKLSKLGTIALSENKRITTRGLTYLSRLKELRYLTITGVHIDDQGYATISKMPLVYAHLAKQSD